MKYKTINNSNFPNHRNGWIDEALSNHQTIQSTRSQRYLLEWCSGDFLDGFVDDGIDGEQRWTSLLPAKTKSLNLSRNPCSKLTKKDILNKVRIPIITGHLDFTRPSTCSCGWWWTFWLLKTWRVFLINSTWPGTWRVTAPYALLVFKFLR